MAVELFRGKIPIIKRSLNDGFIRGDAPSALSTGCIDRDFAVDPVMMGDSPSAMVLIDASEDDARYDEQEAQQASLEHMFLRGDKPAFVNLDQNGFPDCATADTEVLTEKGWAPWPEYNGTDLLGTVNQLTRRMEFQPCLKRHVKEYDGPMVYSTNRRVDFGMTPNHRMFVRKWDERKRTLSDKYSFVLAKDLGWYSGLMHAPSGFIGTDILELEVPGDRRYDGDDFFALLALIISDGYAGGSPSTRNWVSFCCFDERYQIVAALAARVGFKESSGRRGVFTRYDAGALAEWTRQNCYTSGPYRSHTKKVPQLIKEASSRQIAGFLNWFGDRSKDDAAANMYYTSSKRLADDLQELFLRVGKRTTICPRTEAAHESGGKLFKESSGFVLVVSGTERLCLERKKHIETDRYKGLVYCATVPNSTLITRRNGSVLISGNCWAHSTGHTMMLNAMFQNIPIPQLNAVAVATLLRQTNGGWCGLSMKFAREHGYPLVGTGPGQWPYHSRKGKDTPELRADMARHMNLEDWYDFGLQEYNQKLTIRQLATCSHMNWPSAVDYNVYGHSMCQLRRVRLERGRWGGLILNSWLGFGYFGLCVIPDDVARPNNAVALRSGTATAA